MMSKGNHYFAPGHAADDYDDYDYVQLMRSLDTQHPFKNTFFGGGSRMVLRWKGGGPVATKSMENLVFLLSYSPSPLFSSLLWLLWFSDRDQLFTLHWYNAGIMCIVI